MAERDQHTLRFLELIEQMGNELQRERGWKTEVAKKLGISASYLPQLKKDETRSVRKVSMVRAAKRLGIRIEFFDALKGQHYREFKMRHNVVFEDSKELLAALDLAEELAGRSSNPNAVESRRIAMDLMTWAERELKTVKYVHDLAQRVLTSDDATAPKLGGELTNMIYMWKGSGPAATPTWPSSYRHMATGDLSPPPTDSELAGEED